MKKTTLLRKTAYLVSPQIADGFVPPANFDYKISVSLHEVDIKIYGFTGTSWELMHNSDGAIASFETEVQHQKYYFESKSGQEQTVRVSFLSTENAAGAGIRTGVTAETRRVYDIEEIPVYNGSRDGAMLTVMSDGSLAWLLVNESFVIPGANPVSSYLESSATLYGDANLNNGTLVLDGTGDYAVIDDGFRFTDKMTTSVWFKTSATGDRRIYSSHVRQMGGADYRNGFFARLNNGQLKFRHPAGGTGELTGPSGLNDGAWHHLALSWEAGVGYVLYVDGAQRKTGGSGASDGYAAGWGLYIGANPWNNKNPYALFDGEIKKFEVLNEVLTAQQVTDRFNEG